MRKVWMRHPHVGGKPIPPPVQERTRLRLLKHASKRLRGKDARLDIRFRGHFCYVDAFEEPAPPTKALLAALNESREAYLERLRSAPIHLCRLRYRGDENAWTLAFYTYSHEKYEPCVFRNGSFYGTPEEAFDIASVYLP